MINRGRATPGPRHAYAYVHERCRGRPAVARLAGQGRGLRAGDDRPPLFGVYARRSQHDRHKSWGAPAGDTPAAALLLVAVAPSGLLAAPVAGRGALRVGRGGDGLHPARLRQRRGAVAPMVALYAVAVQFSVCRAVASG